MSLPAIPPAVYHGPTCPICDGELSSDPDIHQCEACGLYWPVDDPDAAGEIEELDGPRCDEEHRPYTDDGYTIDGLFKGAVYRCIRLAAHRLDDPAVCAGVKVAGLERITNTLTWRTKDRNDVMLPGFPAAPCTRCGCVQRHSQAMCDQAVIALNLAYQPSEGGEPR